MGSSVEESKGSHRNTSEEEEQNYCIAMQLAASSVLPMVMQRVIQLDLFGIIADDVYFNWNWAGACWDRWIGSGTVAGPVRWLWMLRSPAKATNKGGSARARSSPLRCLS